MKANILIIEDNPGILDNLFELFNLEGYRVSCATNGDIAISMAEARIPDIILCDIMMPGKNGFEILQAFRNSQELKNIPFVFISAVSEKDEITKGLSLGADAFLVKPFEEETLLATVKKLVEKKAVSH